VKGAFTDAKGDQDGYFSLVGHGTLFLDEVGELSLGLQARLLRVLETRTFRPLGPTAREVHFKGRVIAATHVDLKERVREKRFREDLYYRLNVLTLHVPPLSEHREDIPALVQHFLKKYNRPLHFTQEAIEQLCVRGWPGNVRELRNDIEKLAYLAETDRIEAGTLTSLLPQDARGDSVSELLELMAQKILTLPIEDKIAALHKALVQEAMKQAEGNITEAARKLGRHRKYVERALKKLSHPDGDDSEE
jgi:DNA-binding NtrC family response regulator